MSGDTPHGAVAGTRLGIHRMGPRIAVPHCRRRRGIRLGVALRRWHRVFDRGWLSRHWRWPGLRRFDYLHPADRLGLSSRDRRIHRGRGGHRRPRRGRGGRLHRSKRRRDCRRNRRRRSTVRIYRHRNRRSLLSRGCSRPAEGTRRRKPQHHDKRNAREQSNNNATQIEHNSSPSLAHYVPLS